MRARHAVLITCLVGVGWLLAPVIAASEGDTFWRAIKTLTFDDPAVRGAQGEQREYARALQRVIQGEEGSENEVLRLCDDARDARFRRESRRVCAELLAAASRWAELDARQRESEARGSNDGGRAVAAEFSKLPPATLDFPDGPTVLPTRLNHVTGSPMVEVAVNGHKRWFWVDTGARLTVLASDVAQATGIAPLGIGVTEAHGATTRTVPARPAVIHDLALGEIRFRNHPVVILRAEDMRFKAFGLFTLLKIDGILGWNAISQLDVEIDYAQPRVVVRRPVRRATAIRNLFWLGQPLIRGSGPDGADFVFFLDTGARSSWASPELLRKTQARVESERTRKVSGAGRRDEATKVRTIAPVEARVGDCSVRLNEVRENRLPMLVLVDGFAGVDLAGRGWMRLDPTNGVFECRPQPPAVANAQ
jgi:hypothetical protein